MLRVLTILAASFVGAALTGAVTPSAAQSASQGRWESTARLDAPRAGLAVAVLDGRLYAAGGSGLTEPRVEFEAYDAELERWMPERPLVLGLERFGMAAINGRIYAAGGYALGDDGVGPTAGMWSWSPDGGVWQSEIAMPGPKADFNLIAAGDTLYAIGGTRDDGAIYAFDPEETEWRSIAAPAGAMRRGAAAVVVDGQVYVIGGSLDGVVTARVDVYDPQADSWQRAADLPEARSGVAAAYYQGRIHVFGGRAADNRTTLSAHSSLAPGDANWTGEPDLPSPRTSADAAVLGDGVYLVGGGSGGGFFAPFTALDATDIFVDEAS